MRRALPAAMLLMVPAGPDPGDGGVPSGPDAALWSYMAGVACASAGLGRCAEENFGRVIREGGPLAGLATWKLDRSRGRGGGQVAAAAPPRPGSPEAEAHRWVRRAERLRRDDHDAAASRAYRYAAAVRGWAGAAGALLEAAFLAVSAGDEAGGAALSRRVISEASGTEQARRAAWLLGRIHWRRGRADEALRAWESAGGERNGGRSGRAEWWRGRALEALGRRGEAEALWRDLAQARPLSYHGQLARGRLGLGLAAAPSDEALPPSPLPPPLPPFAPPPFPPPLPPLDGPILLALEGERELAWDAVAWLLREERLPPEGVDFAAALALRVRGPGEALRILFRRASFETWPRPGEEARWRMAFPRPRGDALAGAAAEAGVDPHLLAALVRHESGFETDVRSRVGASGLGQLLLATAREVAVTRLGETPPSAEDLMDPARNLRLTAAYLRWLLDVWDGSATLAVASYNAGPGRVRGWLGDKVGRLEEDDLVEELPWRRARVYCRRVLEARGVYATLYGDPPSR